VVLALIAVYLTSEKSEEKTGLSKSILLPVILFFGSGVIDTLVNYLAPDDKLALFSAAIFGFAFIIGVIVLILKPLSINLILN